MDIITAVGARRHRWQRISSMRTYLKLLLLFAIRNHRRRSMNDAAAV